MLQGCWLQLMLTVQWGSRGLRCSCWLRPLLLALLPGLRLALLLRSAAR
jgi:hypothetical protein